MFANRLTYNLVILFTNNLFSFFLGKPVRISTLEKVGGVSLFGQDGRARE